MDRLTATYLVRADAAGIESRSRALAVEQSVEMPLDAVRDRWVLDEVVARVEAIEPAAPGSFTVRLGLSTATIGRDLAQLLNMAFGNCSLQPDVELVDVDLPADLLRGPVGPQHGVDGLRRLVGAPAGRPLTCTALKPQGLTAHDLAALAATFASSGIDVVKDDHGLADQDAAPFARRVAACQAAVRAANRATGHAARYAPSLVGGPRRLADQLRIARSEGVEIVLVAPMLTGLPAFAELVAAAASDATGSPAVLAHPALSGATRIAPPLLLGKLFRLAGADATIFPAHGGRFGTDPAACAELAHQARRPWGDLRPCLPVPAGGLTLERVPELVSFYGTDSMLLIGGALLQAGASLADATRRFVERVAAAGRDAAPSPPPPTPTTPNPTTPAETPSEVR